MKDYIIYESGGMMAFGKDNFNKSNDWRKYCKRALEDCECDYKVKVFNPNDYFNFFDDKPLYSTQREVMNFDLHNLRKSDLVIVNFNDLSSLGTMAEIAIAYDRGIPIIGLNENGAKLHPWQECMCERAFEDINEMLDYVEDFYLK